MDKTYFLEEEVFDDNKMVFKFTQPYKGLDTDNYPRTIIKQLLDIFKSDGVDTNKHISNTGFHFIEGEGNSRFIVLDVNINEGKLSKSHIRDKVGVLRKIIGTPGINAKGIGKARGKDNPYFFDIHNIEESISENIVGVFIFSIAVEERRQPVTYQNQYMNNILKIDAVTGNNKEYIEFAKANGALQFAYYEIHSESGMKDIINDIKEGEDYLYQIENYPEMGIENGS